MEKKRWKKDFRDDTHTHTTGEHMPEWKSVQATTNGLTAPWYMGSVAAIQVEKVNRRI